MAAKNTLVTLVLDAWADLDAVLSDLDPAAATQQVAGGSAFAWTLAHATIQVDSWINMRFQGRPRNQLLADPRFDRGSSGAATDWDLIRQAVDEVRASALPFLLSLEENADQSVPYDGSLRLAREADGLNLRFALARIASHHYIHIGEIAAVRSRLLGAEDLTDNLASGTGFLTKT